MARQTRNMLLAEGDSNLRTLFAQAPVCASFVSSLCPAVPVARSARKNRFYLTPSFPSPFTEVSLHSANSMDWLAELWVRSGRSTRRLYKGSTEGIVTALKAWVERRKAHNDTDMAAHWKMLQTLDSLHQIGDLSGRIRQDKAAEMMEQIAKITAAQVEQLDCNRVSCLLIVERVDH